MTVASSEAKQLAEDALKCAQAANGAMNEIDQAALPKGVWDVLYQQNEAISQLAIGLLFLASERNG